MEYNWKEYKEKRLLELKSDIENSGLVPTLAIIQVGSLPESNSYIKNKIKACELIGVSPLLYSFSEGVSASFLKQVINQLNSDERINGIFMQLPAPGLTKEEESEIIETINPLKDVDGLTRANFSSLAYGEESLVPCTPKGVMEMLQILTDSLDGKDVTIIGRSHLVGLPLFQLLQRKNATVTLCHSHTSNLGAKTKASDIVITAVGGHKNLITADMIKEGAIVIDVAISKDPETGKWYGDCDYEAIKEIAAYITPVPGGVGQLTVLELMDNVVKSAKLQRDLKQTQNFGLR